MPNAGTLASRNYCITGHRARTRRVIAPQEANNHCANLRYTDGKETIKRSKVAINFCQTMQDQSRAKNAKNLKTEINTNKNTNCNK